MFSAYLGIKEKILQERMIKLVHSDGSVNSKV
jgi:hypothetical protein